MCVTCGCSDNAETTVTKVEAGVTQHEHVHILPDGTAIAHSHGHDGSGEHHHTHENGHDRSALPQEGNRKLTLEENILAKNDLIAAQNRGWFEGRGILALNLVSSPGSGKTALLTRTIQDLKSQLNINVIEGDQATANDAQRIRETGCQVVQINTGTGCHLEASMVQKGVKELNPPLNSVLAIENVGNLVCPALFDLGEYAKVVILSITEGEDKPIKYPHMFRNSQIAILNKIDLLPYVSFNVDRCLEYIRLVNPHMKVFQVSATTGAGMDEWYRWLSQLQDRIVV